LIWGKSGAALLSDIEQLLQRTKVNPRAGRRVKTDSKHWSKHRKQAKSTVLVARQF